MSKEKKGFWRWVRDMKEWDELDEAERSTVKVGCCSGIAVGLTIGFLVTACVTAIAIAAVLQ
jgi:hypothetical protein